MLALALLLAGAPADSGCFRVVGDVSLARAVGEELARTGRSPWSAFAGEPRRRWIGNLEGAVRPGGAPCTKAAALCLGMEAQALRPLAELPFAALSLANNHSLDHGSAGLLATRRALSELGIGAIEEQPLYLQLGDHRLGWIAVNLADRGLEERTLALEALRSTILRARAEAELVVVLPHWGQEGQAEPDRAQRELAAQWVRWGAGLIAGAHAHRPQGSSCADGAAIYYGLGNHLFDQPDAGEGWMLDCCPEGQELSCAVRTTRRGPRSTYPLPTSTPPQAACRVALTPPDTRWQAHPHAAELVTVEPFAAAGEGAFFALRRTASSFDGETALRPYVFRVRGGEVRDVWRGTSLAWPLVAARLIGSGGEQRLCALHRGDSFLHPQPSTLRRRRAVYAWTGFGFRQVHEPDALAACALH